MPTISGNVFYTPTNDLVPVIGIPNVPVVLRDPFALNGAIALTDVNGEFVFMNVPNGTYQLIEAWGTPGGIATPVNYPASLTPMPAAPNEAEPPLSAITVAPPPLADMLMAISPNLLNLTVSGDLASQYFYDAPVGSKPIVFSGLQMVGPNLISAADNGSFGTVPAGSPVNTIPAVAPYPAATPGLPYQAAPEITDGHYSIANIRRAVNTRYNWWNLSDHETMLETGRFMFVNGDLPGALLFTDTVNVTPDTFYTFTGWGLNLLNVDGIPPRFSIRVTGSDGSVLGYELLNSINHTPIPIWYQSGFLFNSGIFSSVTVEVISEAPASIEGNDYVVDELRLFETNIIDLLQLQKTMTPSTIYSSTSGAGQDVAISVTATNTSSFTAPHVVFQDTIDPRLQFVPGSVTVNGSGTGFETADPNSGFPLGDMAPGAVNTVMFHATTQTAGPAIIPNTANVSYDAATNGNGDIIRNTIYSNTANLEILINRADVIIEKLTDKDFAKVGDILTYTLNLQNVGNVSADNVILTDFLPAGVSYVAGSLVITVPYTGTLTSGLMLTNPIAAAQMVSLSFKVKVDSIPNPNPVCNQATAEYTYTVDPAAPDSTAAAAKSNKVETIVFRYHFNQQVSDLIHSVALEQAALAAIVNGEGAKIQKMTNMKGVTTQQLLCLNQSMSDMMDSITILETVLRQKLSMVDCRINSDCR